MVEYLSYYLIRMQNICLIRMQNGTRKSKRTLHYLHQHNTTNLLMQCNDMTNLSVTRSWQEGETVIINILERVLKLLNYGL